MSCADTWHEFCCSMRLRDINGSIKNMIKPRISEEWKSARMKKEKLFSKLQPRIRVLISRIHGNRFLSINIGVLKSIDCIKVDLKISKKKNCICKLLKYWNIITVQTNLAVKHRFTKVLPRLLINLQLWEKNKYYLSACENSSTSNIWLNQFCSVS